MNASAILDAIQGKRALAIGDICLDRWCDYDPALGEPSRETGLTRVAVVKTVITAGAGGTVANNLAALIAKHLHEPPPPFPKTLGISTALESVCLRALAKDRNRRQPDAIAFGRELQYALTSPTRPPVSRRAPLKWIAPLVTSPLSARRRFEIALSVVVFPAPLAPRRATMPPSGTARETPFSTRITWL